MDQVFVHNLTKEDITAMWGGEEFVIKAGQYFPTERGIAEVWMKHHGDNKPKKDEEREVYMEIKEMDDLVVEEKVSEPKKRGPKPKKVEREE